MFKERKYKIHRNRSHDKTSNIAVAVLYEYNKGTTYERTKDSIEIVVRSVSFIKKGGGFRMCKTE